MNQLQLVEDTKELVLARSGAVKTVIAHFKWLRSVIQKHTLHYVHNFNQFDHLIMLD